MSNTAKRRIIGYDRSEQDSKGEYYTYTLFCDFSAESAIYRELHGSSAVNDCLYVANHAPGSEEAESIKKIVSKPAALQRYHHQLA